MPALPEGTVSLLFTGVEGSTAALKRLGERYAGVLLEHERVLRAARAARSIHAALVYWNADYPTPAGFLAGLFLCGTPLSTFTCSPALDRAIYRAAATQAAGVRTSGALWTAADRLIVDQALVVPLTNPTATTLGSTRLGNLQTHLLYGPLYDQAWVA